MFLLLFLTMAKNHKKKAPAKWVASAWFLISWSHLGLNQGLPDYESGALTNWAMGPLWEAQGIGVSKATAKLRQKFETAKTFDAFLL